MIIAFLALVLICVVGLRLILSRRNKRFDILDRQVDAGELQSTDPSLTEEEVRAIRQGYRYII